MSFETGYVGLTDPDWYSYLLSQPKLDEVNFWQPHGGRTFRAIQPGDLFFFKLRAPYRAIAGFGFFQRFESLPAWLAWESFGEMNGAPTYEAMLNRIGQLRHESGDTLLRGDFRIGCIMLSAPVLFGPQEQVQPPADWARSGIQQGKKYDLRTGEGHRLLAECLERAQSGNRYWNVQLPEGTPSDEDERFGTPTLIKPRLGQGLFTFEVRDAYHNACAVTGEHSTPVLEAAHIFPYAQGGQHRVDNGILLRRDLHRLFDKGYVTIDPSYVFRVGSQLREEFGNGRSYYNLDGTVAKVPDTPALRPNRELLDWHGRELFKR